VLACKSAMNYQRFGRMRDQLAEVTAARQHGAFFRGFYIEDNLGGVLQSCDRRREWRLQGEPDVLIPLSQRYDGITRDNLEMVYVELRGKLEPFATPAAGLGGNMQVNSVSLFRAIAEHDCSAQTAESNDAPAPEIDSEVPPGDETVNSAVDALAETDLTVDELGAAGFLYGYFANWVASCAVDQTSVCQAQTEARYSLQGEWLLTVDRSLAGDWRLRLTSTISEYELGRSLTINIDGDVAVTRQLAADATFAKVNQGVILAEGAAALELMSMMRGGQELSAEWQSQSGVFTRLEFSLLGITRALRFFDQNG